MTWLRRIIVALAAIQIALLEAHFGSAQYAPMAVVLIEGFDHFGSGATLSSKGWNNVATSMVAGRFGGNAARYSSSGSGVVSKALPSSYATLFGGVAWYAGTSTTGVFDIFILLAGTTQTVRVGIDASSHLIVRNSGGTTIATGTTALTTGIWYYIEVKAFINGASGTCEVHLNGVSEIASTTGNFGSTNLDHFAIVNPGSSREVWFDDCYALDTTGTYSTFLGDVRVATIYPSADGANTAWTPDSGTAHYSRVNEHSGTYPDGDTSYVSDSTPGDRDTYVCDDIDGGATVYGVQTNLYARKDDAATRQIASVIRQGSTNYDGTTVTLTSTYTYYSQLYSQDPTSADWTAGNVNADEFGVKEVA